MLRIFVTALAALVTLSLCGCPKRDAAADRPADPTAADPAPAHTEALAERQEGEPLPEAEGGLPVPIQLPTGAVTDPTKEIKGRIVAGGSRLWTTPFVYGGDFYAVVADLDQQLKPLGYRRVIGPSPDRDPMYHHGVKIKPTKTEGVKSYISEDNLKLVRLNYWFTRGEGGAPDNERFELQVLVFAEPQPVNEPSHIEDI